MITKVVVPLDGSRLAERAVAPGCALAERVGAQLVFLTSRWGDDVDAPRDYLENVAADLGYQRVQRKVIQDRIAASAILTETDDPGTVVCMATHGRSGIGEALLGSVAEEVLLRSHRPVLLVGPALDPEAWRSEHWFHDGKVLVTVDGSKTSEAIVPVAAEWSRLLGLQPRVVQVAPGGESANLREVARALAQGDAKVQWEVLHGDDVAASILDEAIHLPATLIAMATHGRTGLPRVTLGSVAMQVVHRSRCPVLVKRSVS